MIDAIDADRYLRFERKEWAELRAQTPLTLHERDLEALRGINDRIDLDEVVAVYLPLTRLLNLYVSATQNLHRVSATFLGAIAPKMPYVIGIAGSVAVGKSTSARILQALLTRWPEHPRVELITTDGFLYPNAVLNERGIMNRKGFPESYDTKRLIQFLRELKAGMPAVSAPVYSHVEYDIVPNDSMTVRQPDILILEGLNVLQTGVESTEFVSDYFDFSIYIDLRGTSTQPTDPLRQESCRSNPVPRGFQTARAHRIHRSPAPAGCRSSVSSRPCRTCSDRRQGSAARVNTSLRPFRARSRRDGTDARDRWFEPCASDGRDHLW
ncbi:MAG: type I pantothenate kinase [Actinobacteria bacterium]|nr:type I pantothenate kinase [Actinomycetota bacterium]